MPNKIYYTWENIALAIDTLCVGLEIKEFVGVYGIPRGGCIVATILSHRLDVPYITSLNLARGGNGLLIVDDIADTGGTIRRLKTAYDTATYATLDYNPSSVVEPDYWVNTKDDSDWIVYPWERRDSETVQDYLKDVGAVPKAS
jgi:xanthine phosphoribosyltransferase